MWNSSEKKKCPKTNKQKKIELLERKEFSRPMGLFAESVQKGKGKVQLLQEGQKMKFGV